MALLNYTVLITAKPTAAPSYQAFQFTQALLMQSHKIQTVFFYADGVYHGMDTPEALPEMLNLNRLWQALAQQYNLKLALCMTAAARRSIEKLSPGFYPTGLAQLMEAMQVADRFIQFGT